MNDVVIVEAVRSPIGRRKGGLVRPASGRPARRACSAPRSSAPASTPPRSDRSSAAASRRSASSRSTSRAPPGWRRACRWRCAATTVDSQCGSSQQATTLAAGLIGAGIEDLVLACGVEMMTRVPLGANMKGGSPLPKSYARALRLRVAVPGRRDDRQGVRHHPRGHRSLRPAQPDAGDPGLERRPLHPRSACRSRRRSSTPRASRPARRKTVARDEGLRETSMEKLAALNPVEPDGVHTAGTSSQVSDGAAAVLLASPQRAAALGLRPRARRGRASPRTGIPPQNRIIITRWATHFRSLKVMHRLAQPFVCIVSSPRTSLTQSRLGLSLNNKTRVVSALVIVRQLANHLACLCSPDRVTGAKPVGQRQQERH